MQREIFLLSLHLGKRQYIRKGKRFCQSGRFMAEIIELLKANKISDEQLAILIESSEEQEELIVQADRVRRSVYGTDVYIRGLIEVSNYCKNNCRYCGIRIGNSKAVRYRLSKQEILECCAKGYDLGFRTFVLQGGEDPHLTDGEICDIVRQIKLRHSDCAVTLSLGEKSRDVYKAYRDSGADRYLLRHETATETHYKQLHPSVMSFEKRQDCLWTLKDLDFQVGSGFMVGSPYQTTENLVADIRFLQRLQPDMIGIGPFLSHKDTPFSGFENGDLGLCLRLIAILRLMFPFALIPSTTAMGTLHPKGRELGLCAGANVVMPNLSPSGVRQYYNLYDNKAYSGEEAAESVSSLKESLHALGYEIVADRGDAKTVCRDKTILS